MNGIVKILKVLVLFSLFFGNLIFANICQPNFINTFTVDIPLHFEKGDSSIKVRQFFGTMKPFDPSKKNLLLLPGGPGGTFHQVYQILKNHPLAQQFNLITFDQRGIGCTHILDSYNASYEKGLYSMERTSIDLEAIRKKLLGESGRWSVYGFSYGGMLAQAYVSKFPEHVDSLVLDSTMHRAEMNSVARKQFISLIVNSVPATRYNIQKIKTKFPKLLEESLQIAFAYSKTYYGRTQLIPTKIKAIADSKNQAEASQLINKEKSNPSISYLFEPSEGMNRQIICEEIWDYPGEVWENNFFFPHIPKNCVPFKNYRTPMNFTSELKKLTLPTVIIAGQFDPVTPNQSAKIMHNLIANSRLLVNAYAGHLLLLELPECTYNIIAMAVMGNMTQVDELIASQQCRKEPEQRLLY